MSAPAEKARSPAPVRMTALIAPSASYSVSASSSSLISGKESAFNFSGRFNVISAQPSRRSVRMKSYPILLSFPRARAGRNIVTEPGGLSPPGGFGTREKRNGRMPRRRAGLGIGAVSGRAARRHDPLRSRRRGHQNRENRRRRDAALRARGARPEHLFRGLQPRQEEPLPRYAHRARQGE